jgi:Tfp pilus assembly protein PilF
LQIKLTAGEQERVWRRYTDNLEAYDYFLRGVEYLQRFTHEANVQARQLFGKAIELDPQFALAHALLGWTHLQEWTWQWSLDPQALEQTFTLAQKAISLDDSLPLAHVLLGYVYQWKNRQHDQAIAELKRAIALDPNDAE